MFPPEPQIVGGGTPTGLQVLHNAGLLAGLPTKVTGRKLDESASAVAVGAVGAVGISRGLRCHRSAGPAPSALVTVEPEGPKPPLLVDHISRPRHQLETGALIRIDLPTGQPAHQSRILPDASEHQKHPSRHLPCAKFGCLPECHALATAGTHAGLAVTDGRHQISAIFGGIGRNRVNVAVLPIRHNNAAVGPGGVPNAVALTAPALAHISTHGLAVIAAPDGLGAHSPVQRHKAAQLVTVFADKVTDAVIWFHGELGCNIFHIHSRHPHSSSRSTTSVSALGASGITGTAAAASGRP